MLQGAAFPWVKWAIAMALLKAMHQRPSGWWLGFASCQSASTLDCAGPGMLVGTAAAPEAADGEEELKHEVISPGRQSLPNGQSLMPRRQKMQGLQRSRRELGLNTCPWTCRWMRFS